LAQHREFGFQILSGHKIVFKRYSRFVMPHVVLHFVSAARAMGRTAKLLWTRAAAPLREPRSFRPPWLDWFQPNTAVANVEFDASFFECLTHVIDSAAMYPQPGFEARDGTHGDIRQSGEVADAQPESGTGHAAL
jgi:hypothetical protein